MHLTAYISNGIGSKFESWFPHRKWLRLELGVHTLKITTQLINDIGRFDVRWWDMHGRHPLTALIQILDRSSDFNPKRIPVR